MDATLLWVGLPRVSLAHIWMYRNAIEDIRCLLSFVAHFDWLSPHNRSTFQRCLHTYVNLSSGCNTFMSWFAQSQPGTHLNVQKCDRRHSLFVVVCCTLRLTVSTQSQHFSTMFAYLCKLVEWMQHFYELVCPESAWHTFECTEMRDEDIRCLLSFVAHFDWLSPHNRSTFQRCLHTYVNLSSGCNTFMSRLAESRVSLARHSLNVRNATSIDIRCLLSFVDAHRVSLAHVWMYRNARRHSLFVVVCCTLRTVSIAALFNDAYIPM